MSGVVGVVRSLLEALRHAGRQTEADMLEREFEARDWDLGQADQLDLLRRLEEASSQTTMVDEVGPRDDSTERAEAPSQYPGVPPLPSTPAAFARFEALGPWVAHLPGGWSHVDATQNLLVSAGLSELVQALAHVFVNGLGYEAHAIDETARLATQKTITAVHIVCRHDDFYVVAASSTYAGYHTSSYEPIFRLHPRCVVFALEAGARLRVLVRRIGSGTTQQIGQRVLRGRGRRSFPDDDLFVWARRLATLEPTHEDDGRALARRADDVLRARVEDVAANWPSAPVDPTAIPGVSWEEDPSEQISRFLQPDPETRLYFGLNVELPSSFPWRSRSGDTELHFHGYRVTRQCGDIQEAEAQGATLVAELELDLEVIIGGKWADTSPTRRHRFTLPGTVTIPDAAGIFVIYGRRYRFVPGLASRETVTDTGAEPDPSVDDEVVLDAEDTDADQWADVNDGEDTSDTTVSDPATEIDIDAPARVYAGAGLVPLLRWSTGRRLRALAAQFALAPADELNTLTRVRWWLGHACDGQSRLELTARTVLMPYLEPTTTDQLRTLVVSPGRLEPAYCVELARVLNAGRAYPVLGARIGPGGVLYGPVLHADGHVALHAGPWPDGTDSPRLAGERPFELDLHPWIAGPLRRFADLPVGALSCPLDVACATETWTGLVFADNARHEHLHLARETLPASRCRQRWVYEIPCSPATRNPPHMLAKVGSDVEVGDPVATFVRPWVDAMPRSHELFRVGRELASGKEAYKRAVERERARAQAKRKGDSGTTEDSQVQPRARAQSQEESAARNDSLVLRCPPSARGRVEDLRFTSLRDRRGHIIRYRITLDTSVPTKVSQAVLPDGRTVPVFTTPRADLPWQTESGDMADGYLGPAEPWKTPTGKRDSEWRDGWTGRTLAGRAEKQTLVLITAESPRPPDPCLRYRALDGWGCPRAAHDPSISMGEFRELASIVPDDADQLNAAMRNVYGHAPAAQSIHELCQATFIRPPMLVPSNWADTDTNANEYSTYDPLRTVLHRSSSAPYTGDSDPWEWTCDCGDHTGLHRAQLRCARCSTSVKKRWRGSAPASVELRLPVIHPWRKRLVAALLGLCDDELQSIIRTCDCSPLLDLTRESLGNPTRSLARRLERCADEDERRRLTAMEAFLEQALGGGLRFDDLWLSRVRILSGRLLFDGYRTAIPTLASSPLTARYRQLEALTRIEYGENEILRRAVWVEQQKAVDALFGDFEDTRPPPGTLAELWRRVWPTTAPARVRIAVPGLFSSCDSDLLRRTPSARLLGAEIPVEVRTYDRGILGPDGVYPLTVQVSAVSSESDVATGIEKDAWASCRGPLLSTLAAMCLGIDAQASVSANIHVPPVVRDAGVLGPVVLRELLARLRPPYGSPRALLDILQATDLFVLPSARDEAVARIEARLGAAIPGEQVGAILVREALSRVLAGFWVGPAAIDEPHHWRWALDGHGVPARYRRIVPNLNSSAWRVWPGFDLMTNPIAAALRGWPQDMRGAYGVWFGLTAMELPPRDTLLEPAGDRRQPTPTRRRAEIASSALLVRVLTMSLRRWIHQQSEVPAHVEG